MTIIKNTGIPAFGFYFVFLIVITQQQRISYAQKSLLGLSIGDAFGDSFFGETETVWSHIENRSIPSSSKWEFTDDTVMAIAVYEQLLEQEAIDRERLAKKFADNYRKDINRGYGATAHKILREIGEGYSWKQVSMSVFDGQGSMGNGGAMRAAPVGAYFFDQKKQIIDQTKKSAEVTHYHHEAQVGAVAVALAAALALQLRRNNETISAEAFLKQIYNDLEESDTKAKIGKALHLPKTYRVETVTSVLGNGIQLLAQDTVPFALWCAAHRLDNFEEALWTSVSGLGDRDTIGAIVGSIVILYADEKTVPQAWIGSVEKFGASIFLNGK